MSRREGGTWTTYRVPRLKELREAAGMTQVELATEMRCPRQNIWRWEAGGGMSYRSLIRLAAALGQIPSEISDWPLPPNVGR